MKHSLGLLSASAVFAAFIAAPAHAYAQSPATQAQDPHDHDHQGAAAPTPGTASEQRQGMMNMMADMQASGAKLDALVQAMDAAKGAEKTEAMATLLTALVKEHSAMQGHMTSMMNMMGMMGMTNNMPAGMSKMPDKAKP